MQLNINNYADFASCGYFVNQKTISQNKVCLRATSIYGHYMGTNISHSYQNRIHNVYHTHAHCKQCIYIAIQIHAYVYIFSPKIYCIHFAILCILIRVITRNLLLSTFFHLLLVLLLLLLWRVCRGSLFIFLLAGRFF